jgi:hypothetical protein
MSIYTYNFAKNMCEILEVEFDQTQQHISDQELDIVPEDSIIGATDYVSGMVWITNGEEDTYIDPKDSLPSGWRYGRSVNHMAHINPEKWSAICSESSHRQWENNSQRKKSLSNRMQKYWKENYSSMVETARKNGNHGLAGKLSSRALLIDYNGVEYYGWRELQEATGVTKHLYKKYYLHGIDPTSRIGADGPASKTNNGLVHKGGSS